MTEEITQVKLTKEFDGKSISVECTRSIINTSTWSCIFKSGTLLDVAFFAVELFNSTTLNAEYLSLQFGGYSVLLEKSVDANTFTHYLELIASKVKF